MFTASSVDLVTLANDLRRGEIPLPAYLDELEVHFRSNEPQVQAFLPEPGRFDRLHAAAKALIRRYPQEAGRPPLFGLPVGIKDIFHVDGFPTRAGADFPPGHLQGVQAASVSQLVNAGCLVVGKTVTTEFAYFHPGPTRNPHNLAHTPGGSSSGSAAAVAAGTAFLSLGTQTIGSIIRPAAFCGVVGFKPSYGRISRDGIIPLAPSVDHVGVFSGQVEGAIMAARVLCRDWHRVERAALPVLGIPDGPYLRRAGQEALDSFEITLERLTNAGYEIRIVPLMEDFPAIETAHQTIVAAEASEVHAAWFAQHGPLYHARTAELILRGQAVERADLEEAHRERAAFRETLRGVMRSEGIHLWISPAAPGSAPHGLESTGDPVMNLPWTYSGLPTVSVPTARNSAGLPLGLQIIGDWFGDEALLAWASDMEQALQY